MRTARRYLAREIYRSCAVVLMALLGLFTFFALVDDLDNVGDKFSMMALLYMQALAIPTRLYDLLPIGLLIGAILALAGLAQRNELVILRVSGVSGMRLLRMLWILSLIHISRTSVTLPSRRLLLPMNSAVNSVDGAPYISCGVPTCWRRPPARTAMRSPIVSASVWSWVT